MIEELPSRLARVRERIAAAATRVNRGPEEINLVAVSKTHPAQIVCAAIQAGIAELGENRVQETETKIGEVGREAARWHLIGHLQSNKVRRAIELFDIIHSVDSVALAQRLDRGCAEAGRPTLPVLIQVDLSHEETKTGITEDALAELVQVVGTCAHLQLLGLMTVPPFFEEAERVRPYFRRLRELRDELRAQHAFGERSGDLSMGMTHDFEVAIEEGATMIRVGTAIFGSREA